MSSGRRHRLYLDDRVPLVLSVDNMNAGKSGREQRFRALNVGVRRPDIPHMLPDVSREKYSFVARLSLRPARDTQGAGFSAIIPPVRAIRKQQLEKINT